MRAAVRVEVVRVLATVVAATAAVQKGVVAVADAMVMRAGWAGNGLWRPRTHGQTRGTLGHHGSD